VKPPRRPPSMDRGTKSSDPDELDARDQRSEGLGQVETLHDSNVEGVSTSGTRSDGDASRSRWADAKEAPLPSDSSLPGVAPGEISSRVSVHARGLRRGRLPSTGPEARINEEIGKNIFSLASLRALAKVVTRIRRRLGSEG
jgi:hypothetical protein